MSFCRQMGQQKEWFCSSCIVLRNIRSSLNRATSNWCQDKGTALHADLKFSSRVNRHVTCQSSAPDFDILLNKSTLSLTQKYSRTCHTAKSFFRWREADLWSSVISIIRLLNYYQSPMITSTFPYRWTQHTDVTCYSVRLDLCFLMERFL